MKLSSPKPLNDKGSFAVFVPLIPTEGGYHLLYEIRSPKLRRQPSEVCFPGGRMDKGESPTQTAVREMKEELGISPTIIHGETDFLVHRTGEVIYPVLGEISLEEPISFSTEEVFSVFYAPVEKLKEQKEYLELALTPKALFPKESLNMTEDYQFRQVKERFPVYRIGGQIIWGMTGTITESILKML